MELSGGISSKKTANAAETLAYGEDFAKTVLAGNTDSAVLLYGGMGAGKTHFVKGMARGLGITDTVTSPTFALVNEYHNGDSHLYHFDLFRIGSADDLYAIGFHDYIGNGIIAVEWSENIPELEKEFLGGGGTCYRVKIEKPPIVSNDNERVITIDNTRT